MDLSCGRYDLVPPVLMNTEDLEKSVFLLRGGAKQIGEMNRAELLEVLIWAMNNARWWEKEAKAANERLSA